MFSLSIAIPDKFLFRPLEVEALVEGKLKSVFFGKNRKRSTAYSSGFSVLRLRKDTCSTFFKNPQQQQSAKPSCNIRGGSVEQSAPANPFPTRRNTYAPSLTTKHASQRKQRQLYTGGTSNTESTAATISPRPRRHTPRIHECRHRVPTGARYGPPPANTSASNRFTSLQQRPTISTVSRSVGDGYHNRRKTH